MPNTTRKLVILPSGQEYQEIEHFIQKYKSSIIELDENSIFIVKDIRTNGGTVSVDSINFNTELASTPTQVGAFFWDDNNKTFTGIMQPSNGGTVALQVGQEMYKRGVNKTGTTISNGEVVFISGAQGNRPTMDLASSTTYTNAVKTIAMATEDVGNNLYGYFSTHGTVRGLDTDAYTEGDCLWLGTVSGSYTTVTPSFGDARIKVGIVSKSHNVDGEIELCLSENKYMFGAVDDGNYSGFEDDGTLRFVGNATVWRDENAGGVSLTKAVANQPDLVTINGTNIITYAFDGGSTLEELHWANELQHDYKENTDIQPHMHLYPTTDAVGDIKFTLEYYIKKNGTTATQGTTTFVTSSGGTAWEEIRINFDDVIDGTNLEIASQCHFRIFRDPSDVQDGYTNDVAIATVGYHYEVDTIGSRQITTK